jgi:outer membrane protein assembly factor BamB
VPINAECPSCNNRYVLQPDLLGKSMRCPACKDIFIVQEYGAPVPTPPPPPPESAPSGGGPTGNGTRLDAPAPKYQSGSISDFLQVLHSTTELHVEKSEPPEVPVMPDEVLPDVILLEDAEIIMDVEVEEPVKENKPDVQFYGQRTSLPPKPAPSKKDRRRSTASPIVEVEQAEIVEPEPEQIEWSEDEKEPSGPKEVVWSDAMEPPAPKEMVWSADMPEPVAPGAVLEIEYEEVRYREESVYSSSDRDDSDGRGRPRKKKRHRLVVLIFGILFIGGTLGVGGYYGWQWYSNQPKKIFELAKKEYEKGNYEQSVKLFDQLIAENPDFDRIQDAKFFKELSGLRLTIGSVTTANDPTNAHEKLEAFLAKLEDPTMKALADSFAPDIWDAVKRLAEDTFTKAQNSYKLEAPDESEKWLNKGLALEPIAQRFRPKEMGREDVFAKMEQFRDNKIRYARTLQKVLAQGKKLLEDPDDDAIEKFRQIAKDNGMQNEKLVTDLIAATLAEIQRRTRYDAFNPPIPPLNNEQRLQAIEANLKRLADEERSLQEKAKADAAARDKAKADAAQAKADVAPDNARPDAAQDKAKADAALVKDVEFVKARQLEFENLLAQEKARRPESRSTGLLFAARMDSEKKLPSRAAGQGDKDQMVFFALARGVLYALDENFGRVLWAARVGLDSEYLPTRLTNNGRDELVFVPVNDGEHSSISAREPLTGVIRWTQPLPAPCMGRPILVGGRLFVPTAERQPRDGKPVPHNEQGMVLEIDVDEGVALGKITLGRPLGTGGIVQPGTGVLFLPAETHGIYVFDVDKNVDGQRVKPELLGILGSNHPRGTLRAEPVLANQEPTARGPRYLIINQADGLNEMKLRAFPLPPPGNPQVPIGVAEEIPLRGWSWFPPHCDSEKLAFVTDRGEFGLFGINQERNNDSALFVIPPRPYHVSDAHRPERGLVVYADEDTFWILAGERLQQIKMGLDAEVGPKLVPIGDPRLVGEPLHPAETNRRKDTTVVVTQLPESGSCRATAFDPVTGQIRWERQLGLIPQGPPVALNDTIAVIDRNAGLYLINSADLTANGNREWLMDDKWQVVPPLSSVASHPVMFPQADGRTVLIFATIESPAGLELVIRIYSPDADYENELGEKVHFRDRKVGLRSALAGNPILVNGYFIFPLANGSLNRVGIVDGKAVEEGSTWRSPQMGRSAKCHLLAYKDSDFFATDGDKVVQLWRWSGDGQERSILAQLTLSDRIAAAPILISDGGQQSLVVLDSQGVIKLWNANLVASTKTLRTWRPNAKGMPAGKITSGPFAETDAKGKARIAYIIDGVHLVWLSPDAPEPVWVNRRTERMRGDATLGKPEIREGRVYLTDRTGVYRAIDAESGKMLGELFRITGTGAPAGAALPLGKGKLLAPLTDGTLLIIEKKTLPFALIPIPPLGIPFVVVPLQ